MQTIDHSVKQSAFKLRGRLCTLMVLQVLDTDLNQIDAQLAEVISCAPRLFDNNPVVLDAAHLAGQLFDVRGLCACLRKHGVIPVAVQSVDPSMYAEVNNLGLAIMHASASQDKPVKVEKNAVVTGKKTKLVTTPVRSGQQIVCKGGDLVVIASVSHGAELLADGHIHVYGTLRGRALAGLAGDRNARIFCHSLAAEMLCISGVYCLSDMIEPTDSPCQIYLQDDRIKIERV